MFSVDVSFEHGTVPSGQILDCGFTLVTVAKGEPP